MLGADDLAARFLKAVADVVGRLEEEPGVAV